ncbi:MAG: S41 family peptidase [Phycisphaerales bacterium]
MIRDAIRVSALVRLAAAALASSLVAAGALAQDAIGAERRAEHVASFDHIWETVRDRQWDPTFDQDAWAQARDEFRPQVEAATSDDEARAAMNGLLGTLGQSHFGVIPKQAYEQIEVGESGSGDLGLTVRLRDDALLVLRVREGSPAAEAGVRPGWTIDSIDGREVGRLLEAAGEAEGVQRAETTVAIVAQGRLGGPVGSEVEIGFRDADGAARPLSLTRLEAPGRDAKFGNLPDMRVAIDARTLEGGVGYFGLNVFFDPPTVLAAYEDWILGHLDAPGLVIDLRGNIGGIGAMAMAMGGWLIDEPDLYLGTMTMKGATLRFALNPRIETYGGPVAVLIDEMSASNSEVLSGGLQDIGRARIFGERTAGLVLLSTAEILPNGDGFQYAFAGYESASGASLEGAGVAPDERILETVETVRSGADPVLDAALEWIASQSH